MWWILFILVVVIVVLWWLLRQNAQATETTMHDEIVEGVKHDQQQEPEHLRTDQSIVEPLKTDDLKVIEGIGPKISSIFQAAGITTFSQLASKDPAYLKDVLEKAGLRLGDPASWPQQAKLAAEGKWDALRALQDSLKGGRETD